MRFSVFVGFVVVFVAFMRRLQVGFSLEAKNFISWDDFKVDEMKMGLASGDEYGNGSSRVIVVDKSGKGQSLTVQGAIDMVPEQNTERVKIYILPGIYREKVFIPSTKPYISFIGSQNRTSDTVISWNNKASDKGKDGMELGTYHSASVTIESDYFCATGITFENTVVADPAGRGMQAVALRIAGDKAVFYKVRILGTQDTLLDDVGSHYFYQSYIQGSIDFIFGRARSLYKDCVLQSTATYAGAVAAHHRDFPQENTGFSFVNCIVRGTGDIYLGRAWGDYSRIIYSYCYFDKIITSSGWSDWSLPSRQKTVEFGEYHCRGGGADTKGRVPWMTSFSDDQIKAYISTNFIDGQQWLRM
ncbi:Pectinesterase, Tyr active site [Trema orientale]|uniref:Pectinesterase n=1 Tax=Trema orientale TaxID=63057 RepID=A0A2P5F8C7_TREOI|nr:Pectinesterase, Tyr active site [Trema orientale]